MDRILALMFLLLVVFAGISLASADKHNLINPQGEFKILIPTTDEFSGLEDAFQRLLFNHRSLEDIRKFKQDHILSTKTIFKVLKTVKIKPAIMVILFHLDAKEVVKVSIVGVQD